MSKIAILNVKYSPNLGDGVIADCIEDQLAKRMEKLEIFSLDIGGMEDYASGGSVFGGGLGLMDRLRKMPNFIQSIVKATLVPLSVKMKYADLWKQKLEGCDALIIGGGHLLMDVDQYFPHRIMTAALTASKKIPVAVYAVGVSKMWTSRGKGYFNRIFNHATLVEAAVRDEQSLRNWQSLFPTRNAKISRDPGLLSAEVYGDQLKAPYTKNPSRPMVAFGVSDPVAMGRHSDSEKKVVCGELEFYMQTLPLLVEQGCDVSLFTNGEDHEFLNHVAESAKSLLSDEVNAHIQKIDRPMQPPELVSIIANADAMIAHRLHANIIAYSYHVPHIGLGWDQKLKSFFDYIKRDDFIMTDNENTPRRVADLTARMLKEGIEKTKHTQVMADAHKGLDELAETLKTAIAAK